MRFVVSLAFAGLVAAPAVARAEVPLSTPVQVVTLLRGARGPALPAAVKRVNKACRGRMRRMLRDYPPLLAEVKRRSRKGPVASRRAVLDLHRCFSPARFREVLRPLFGDSEPAVIAYAAEVAARTEDAELVAPMLAALGQRRKACLTSGLPAAEVEVCVWLTYSPGACLVRAGQTQRRMAGDAVVPMLGSAYPKVREVAVESIFATKMKRYAEPLSALIRREKAAEFAQTNPPELVARFQARRKALARR